MRGTCGVRLAAFLVLLGGRAAIGDLIHVPDDYPTIQEGIDAAVDGDEVVVGDGTWSGPGNTNLDFGGRVITVRSENGREACTIDGENERPGFVFYNDEPAEARVIGFTMRRCVRAITTSRESNGPAPTIEDCLFVNNRVVVGEGGAVHARGATIRGCSFVGNFASLGGAVHSDGLISDCTFDGNIADRGGAIFTVEGGVIEDCSFNRNLATGSDFSQGGAIVVSAWATIRRCTFEENEALAFGSDYARGGAIAASDASRVTVQSSVFCRNIAKAAFDEAEARAFGGAIYALLNIRVFLDGCLFVENKAEALSGLARGGAVYVSSGGLGVVNSTFVGDRAVANDEDGHALSVSLYPYYPAYIRNSIIWDGANQSRRLVVGGEPIAVEYTNIKGGWPGPGNTNIDPLFVDEPVDLRLQPGSPVIDAGDNHAVPDELTEDLDGNPRRRDDPDTKDTGQGAPPVVDMGAYEFQPDGCPEDLDGSGAVDFDDLLSLLTAWGPCDDCPEDLDDSGAVDFDDLLMLLAAWGPC